MLTGFTLFCTQILFFYGSKIRSRSKVSREILEAKRDGDTTSVISSPTEEKSMQVWRTLGCRIKTAVKFSCKVTTWPLLDICKPQTKWRTSRSKLTYLKNNFQITSPMIIYSYQKPNCRSTKYHEVSSAAKWDRDDEIEMEANDK
jgi:hypothetical protein